MDGFGTANRRRPGKKTTVEQCHQLDLRTLARDGAFAAWKTGTLRWTAGDRDAGSIGYVVIPTAAEGLVLTLRYRLSRMGEPGEAIELPIRLDTTSPHLGGIRWWGRCPLLARGAACNRRVAKLYLRGRYFGCRHCHDLTYQSCQENHLLDFYYDSLAERLGISRSLAKRYERDLAAWTKPGCRTMPESIRAAAQARFKGGRRSWPPP